MNAVAMIEPAQRVFGEFGFISQRINFEAIVGSSELRRSLLEAYRESAVSQVLRYMPELFLIHRTVDIQIGALFAKLLVASNELDSQAAETFARFYPDQLALVRLRTTDAGVLVSARWFNETASQETQLAPFLHSALGIEVPRSAVDRLAREGFVVT